MKWRWLWFCIGIVLSAGLLSAGWLIPAHLRATDVAVLQCAARTGASFSERAYQLRNENQFGAVDLLSRAAKAAGALPRSALPPPFTLSASLDDIFWGASVREKNLFHSPPAKTFAEFIIQKQNRETALAHLSNSSSPGVQELLRTRGINNTALFSPSASASGQAFDAAVAETGLLLDGGHLTAGLSDAILALATQANHGQGSAPLEQTLMDFTSLGERLNWDQLTTFVADVPDTMVLHQLTGEMQNAGDDLPALFAAVVLSKKPADVAEYVAKFGAGGLKDVAAGLRYGEGGVGELVARGQKLYRSDTLLSLAAYNPFGGFYYFAAARVLQNPGLMLAVKWFCFLAAGFLLAAALHFARPAVSFREQPLPVRGFYLFRALIFSLGFLLVVVLLSEPFLARENQGESFSLRPHLPMTGGAVAAGIVELKQTVMNPTILLTLLLFFVLQSLLYFACLLKLGEIRRQAVPPRIKLKLLENEDHLFDAGLYLGFVGTIVSLIIASLGLVKFSLMAAYSATSFGIIFVCVFKIFHLRPARRQLLLEAEMSESRDHSNAPAAAKTT